MPATIGPISTDGARELSVVVAQGNLGTYGAGGVALTPANFGLKEILWIEANAEDGRVYKYDKTNSKMKVYHGDNTNAAAAPGVEIGSVDLSAVVTTFLVIGVK